MTGKIKKIDGYVINSLKEIIGILLLPIILRDFGLILAFSYFSFKILKGEREWYLKSLFYFFIYRFLNPLILPPTDTLTICSWLILMIVLTKVLLTSHNKEFNGLQLFFIFCFYSLILAFFKSDYLAISIFKLISFFIGFLAVFLSLKKAISYPWERFLFSIWLVLLLASSITLIIPFIGYARNTTGFQGITNHPQFYGPFNAILGGSFLVLFVLKKIRWIKPIYIGLLLLLNLILVYLSESRTALLILFLLLIISLVILLKNSNVLVKRVEIIIIGIFVFGILFIINFDAFEGKVVNFLAKDRTGSTSEINFDQFSRSRAGLFDSSMENFYNDPWFGIGFGAPNTYYEFEVKYLSGTSIPISASVEKGVILSLLLEEVGIIGFILFMAFYTRYILHVYKYNKAYFPLVLSPLILNMGEATFFSTGGQGIFLWTLLILPYLRINKRT